VSALGGEVRELWRARGLLRLMVRRELSARYAGSALGAVWLYAQPLLTIAAYYLVFDVVFKARLPDAAPTRAVGAFLVAGIVPWLAFCDAVGRGMTSLVDAGSLLQKNAIPPALFPARSVLGSAIVYLPLLVLLVPAYLPLHGLRAAPMLSLAPLVAAALLLWFLLAYALAVLAAALRDVKQFVTFGFAVGIFFSPVLFPQQMFPAGVAWLLWLNPMTPVILGCQSVLLLGKIPAVELWLAIGAWIAGTALLLDRLVARSREQLVDWL
jgi:lipopolysaccharide transport system permease protein